VEWSPQVETKIRGHGLTAFAFTLNLDFAMEKNHHHPAVYRGRSQTGDFARDAHAAYFWFFYFSAGPRKWG
jgi:hypothetical protein